MASMTASDFAKLEQLGDDFVESDIDFDDVDDPIDIAEQNGLLTLPNNNQHLGAKRNRKNFIKAAPSMVILFAKAKTIDNYNIHHDHDDKQSNNNNINTNLLQKHGRKASIVDDLLDIDKVIDDDHDDDDDDDIDYKTLALSAAKEFEKLAQQNDELYKQKEKYRQQYDDLTEKYIELKTELIQYNELQHKYQTLNTQNQQYITKQMIFDQEKHIMTQAINQLNKQIKSLNNDATGTGTGTDDDMDIQMDDTQVLKDDHQKTLIMTQRKLITDLEHEIDEYKMNTKKDVAHIKQLKQELDISQNDVIRLNDNLNRQQSLYINLQKKLSKLRAELLDKDNDIKLSDEYQQKELDLLNKIKEQQNEINKLNQHVNELNQQLNTQNMDDNQLNNTTMDRLRTKQDVMKGVDRLQSFDDDPFGKQTSVNVSSMSVLNDDDESQSSGSSDDNNPDMDDDDQQLIADLKDQITTLKTKMSSMEDANENSVQKLLDLTSMGQSNNDLLKDQLKNMDDMDDDDDDDVEYEEIEIEIEVDSDGNEIIPAVLNPEELAKELELKQQELNDKLHEIDIMNKNKDEMEKELDALKTKNKSLLHHVEEMEQLLDNLHNEKEQLANQIKNLEDNIKDNNQSNTDIEKLKEQKLELEAKVTELNAQYHKTKAKIDHDKKRYIASKNEYSIILMDLEAEIADLREIKDVLIDPPSLNNAVGPPTRSHQATSSLSDPILSQYQNNIENLQNRLSDKNISLKQEKDSHYQTLDKLSKLQDQMEILNDDLKISRASISDIKYRNIDKIQQLEDMITDLNNQLKDEKDKFEKSKSVILSLRKENIEIENELHKLNEKIHSDNVKRQKQRRLSIDQMNDVIVLMQNNSKKKQADDQNKIKMQKMKLKNDEIQKEITNLNDNILQNEQNWKQQQNRFNFKINQLKNKLNSEKEINIKLNNNINNLEKSKIIMIQNTDKEMQSLRNNIKLLQNIIKKQIDAYEILRKNSLSYKFDNMFSWTSNN